MPICAKCETGVGMDLFCPKCYYELAKENADLKAQLAAMTDRRDTVEREYQNLHPNLDNAYKRIGELESRIGGFDKRAVRYQRQLKDAREVLEKAWAMGNKLSVAYVKIARTGCSCHPYDKKCARCEAIDAIATLQDALKDVAALEGRET